MSRRERSWNKRTGGGDPSCLLTTREHGKMVRGTMINKGLVPVRIPGMLTEAWVRAPKPGEPRRVSYGKYSVVVFVNRGGTLTKRVIKRR